MLLLANSGTPDFNDLFVRLFIDLVAFASLAWLLYYRRHGRRDLVFAFGAFNLGVFVVLAAISEQHVWVEWRRARRPRLGALPPRPARPIG